MKNTPTNTKLSLKKIVENLDKIPESGFNEEPKKLSQNENIVPSNLRVFYTGKA